MSYTAHGSITRSMTDLTKIVNRLIEQTNCGSTSSASSFLKVSLVACSLLLIFYVGFNKFDHCFDAFYDICVGGRLKSNRPHVRLVAGCWCLVTFVLVQAYSSTLISFMTTPTLTPLVKSPEDLASQTQINAVVRKYLGTEVVLLVRFLTC